MESSFQVDKGIVMLEDACKFTSRLLENGTVTEIMYLRKTVGNQLLNLIGNAPKRDDYAGAYSIEFHGEMDEFERAVRSAFGRFITESTASAVNAPPPPPLTVNGTSLSNSSPLSMRSSFDGGDLATGLQVKFDFLTF